jgi:tetratricopeptide (TPR) repeat protein
MWKFIILLAKIFLISNISLVFADNQADNQKDITAREAVSIVKKYEKAYMNKNLDKMIEYVDQDSDWFKKGFVQEFNAVFKYFSDINLYHFKYSKDSSIYHVYLAEDGIIVGQNTLYVAYSRSLSDLNEFTEVYSLKKVGEKLKIDASKRMPGDDVEFIDKGTEAMFENKPDKAISYFKKALESNLENSVAHCRLGMIYSRIGRKQEALQELKKAVELRPMVGFYRFYLSQVYYTLGEKEKAAEEMGKALIFDSGLNIFFEK